MKNTIKLILLISILIQACSKENLEDKDEVNTVPIIVTEHIKTNTTWKTGNCYIVEGRVDVKENAILTIEKGVTIKFEDGAKLTISLGDGYGTILANGTAQDPIIFTSNANIKSAGNWEGIYFYDGASGCKFNHCFFEYGGGYNQNYGMLHIDGSLVDFTNCSFSNSETFGISLNAEGQFGTFSNNQFANNQINHISIYGKYLHTIGEDNHFDSNSSIFVNEDWVDLEGNFTWRKQDVPYIFEGDMNVGSAGGITINIEPGTEIKMGNNARIAIGRGTSSYGVIKAIGTAEKPIHFVSASSFPGAGDWYGLWFEDGTSSGTSFDYCTISHAGGYAYGGNVSFVDDVAANVSISNTTISESEKYGVYLHNNTYVVPTLTNITFTANTLGDKNY